MDTWRSSFLQETLAVYRQHQEWADKALAQLESDEAFFKPLGPRSHSVAITVKHVAGNLRSRWLNFLTADGEKPDRNRDQEFIITPEDTRTRLMKAWSDAWTVLYAELGGIHPDDLEKTVTIRGEPHTVIRAIQRSLAHTAYHVGQILYLCRLLKEGDWQWLTVPPGGSRQLNQAMEKQLQKA
jgi:uncharacterized damage-inducible protein DinB